MIMIIGYYHLKFTDVIVLAFSGKHTLGMIGTTSEKVDK
jgi:hypothetical protein